MARSRRAPVFRIRRMGAAQAVHEWEPPRATALARPGVLTGPISPLASVIAKDRSRAEGARPNECQL